MAHVYECIDAKMAAWMEAQPLFFVSTAPLASDGLVNLSPKGTTGTFRVLDEHTFAYLDLTGSGVETIAHLRENGRICVMFCAFDGGPKIVRLHGTGHVTFAADPGFDAAVAPFGEAATSRRPQSRAVITVDVARVSDACGYSVPKMALVEEREILDAWAETRAPRSSPPTTPPATRRASTACRGCPWAPRQGREPAASLNQTEPKISWSLLRVSRIDFALTCGIFISAMPQRTGERP